MKCLLASECRRCLPSSGLFNIEVAVTQADLEQQMIKDCYILTGWAADGLAAGNGATPSERQGAQGGGMAKAKVGAKFTRSARSFDASAPQRSARLMQC
jgi:hypothetical protein